MCLHCSKKVEMTSNVSKGNKNITHFKQKKTLAVKMSVRGTTEHVCVSRDIRQIVCPVTILLHAVSEQNKSQDYP